MPNHLWHTLIFSPKFHVPFIEVLSHINHKSSLRNSGSPTWSHPRSISKNRNIFLNQQISEGISLHSANVHLHAGVNLHIELPPLKLQKSIKSLCPIATTYLVGATYYSFHWKGAFSMRNKYIQSNVYSMQKKNIGIGKMGESSLASHAVKPMVFQWILCPLPQVQSTIFWGGRGERNQMCWAQTFCGL